MSLSGKRVLVLGASVGIGLAVAAAARQQGADILIVSSRKERLDRALKSLPSTGVAGQVVDLSDALFERASAFDHLVFTAGEKLHLEPVTNIQLDAARGFFKLRFWGAFMAAKYGSPHIRPGGSITLTNGIAGLRPRKGWTVAASICGATEALTRALAVELAPIRVNAVCPGPVKTELWSEMPEAEREAMYRETAHRLPVGRVGEAQDLAQTYLYLMQEPYSTGQVIVVDGGAVLV
jgi:NAD(P)-dependent dehydrogenase (short-subunit alcohol dehydrogenase family)